MTRRRLTGAASWLELIAAVAVLWVLWPAWLGGGTSLIVVSGVSMEPTYRDGDVLLVYDMQPEPGDVIAFHVPGRKGQIVHRVAAILHELDGNEVGERALGLLEHHQSLAKAHLPEGLGLFDQVDDAADG